jgi:hypothetical protein
MTRNTRRWQPGILSVLMACRARLARMGTRQREVGAVVIKQSRRPGGCTVAYRAVLRESRRYMIRICRIIESGQMTRYARCRQTCILSAAVAGRALLACMGACKRKTGCAMAE